jgi:hypothetical protein
MPVNITNLFLRVMLIQQTTQPYLTIVQIILVINDPIAAESMMGITVSVVRVVLLVILRIMATAGILVDFLLVTKQI